MAASPMKYINPDLQAPTYVDTHRSMAKHSTNKKTKLLMICMNHPPKSSSSPATFHNQVVPVNTIHNEARRRPAKVGASEDHTNHQDPTSPNISCLGQIKMHELKKEKTKKNDQEDVDPKDEKQSSIRVLSWRFLRCGFGFKTATKSGLRCDGSSRDDTGEEDSIEPILVLQPSMEINLWLRRKAASPPPLQV